MNDCILIHYAEISLKGKNQPEFRKQLLRNIAVVLKSIGIDWPLKQYRGYLLLTVQNNDQLPAVLEKLNHVFGISWFSPAQRFPYTNMNARVIAKIMQMIRDGICNLARTSFGSGLSFRVVVRRSEKRFPGKSVDLEKELGALIIEKTPWKKVDLRNPDCIFNVEIQNREVFLHTQRWPGPGGLPVNSAQKVLVLLSGGIDSPVAAYLAARRGCHVDFVQFSAAHVSPDEIIDSKIGRLAGILSAYTLKSKLYVLPSTYFDLIISGRKVIYELILFRRFMAKTAERLAELNHAYALISGDNLSQVASQTLSNLASVNRAIQIPLLQPLLTYEKEEIISIATRIGTYHTAIEPYKDCCSLFQRNPRTVSSHKPLQNLEDQLFSDYAKTISNTLADMFWIEYKYGKQSGRIRERREREPI
jgi:thiamine biosynthesis protein ThiI